MVAPLLFSFVDQDASPTVVARVGSKVHPEGTPQVIMFLYINLKGVVNFHFVTHHIVKPVINV